MPAIVLKAHTAQGLGAGGTTTSIDTTGAHFICVILTDFSGGATVTLSDSKSNTWTPLTLYTSSAAAAEIRIFYTKAQAVVGTGHTFTTGGTVNASCVAVMAFANVYDATDPLDVGSSGSGSSTTVTSIQPGSLTPGANNELVIAGLVTENADASIAINSSFTLLDNLTLAGGVNLETCSAYLIQTTATAENPTWSWTGGATAASTTLAVFKNGTPPSGTSRSKGFLSMMGVGS